MSQHSRPPGPRTTHGGEHTSPTPKYVCGANNAPATSLLSQVGTAAAGDKNAQRKTRQQTLDPERDSISHIHCVVGK
eukprot:2404062-Prymnesium_polylepis.3